MALFRKDKKEDGTKRATSFMEEMGASLTDECRTLKAVSEKYSDPSALYRPVSLVRPLFRMEEGPLFKSREGAEEEPCEEGVVEGLYAFIELAEKEVREAFANLFSPVTVSAGSTVFSEDDAGDAIYFVSRGKLAVFIKEPGNGHSIELEIVGPGDFFGEESVLGHHNRPYTVRAVEDALLMSARAAKIKPFADNNEKVKAVLESVRERRVSCAIAKVLGRGA